MTRPRTDHNDLARFLERTLSEEEHARALAHLSASDEDAELLADAAFMLRELEAEDGAPVVATDDAADDGADAVADPDPPAAPPAPIEAQTAADDPQVIPFRPPSTQRPRRRIPTQWLALAAVLAGVVLVPLALSRRDGGPGTPAQFAAVLENRTDGVPADWIDRDRFPRFRGDGNVAADDKRAAQLGALLLDLQLAVEARQAEQTRSLTGKIVATLPDTTLSGYVEGIYQQIGERADWPPAELAGLMEDGYENVVALVDPDYFAAGAWTEAAQLAAVSQDAEFFRSRATRRAVRDMADLTMPAAGHTALQAVRAASEEDAPPDWEALTDAVNTLGRVLWR